MSDADLPIEVSCQETQTLLRAAAPPLVIDCREPDEYEVARISGTRLLPMSAIVERLPELAPHRQERIIVHCHHGGRSLRMARWLRQQGFPRAQSMSGGIDQWSLEIDPGVPRY